MITLLLIYRPFDNDYNTLLADFTELVLDYFIFTNYIILGDVNFLFDSDCSQHITFKRQYTALTLLT